MSSVSALFSSDGLTVTTVSNKDLSNVVLKFCDESSDHKFDGLSGKSLSFSWGNRRISGVWIKSGCNSSGDGPGYGEYVPSTNSCSEPTPTPTPQPSATPTPCPTPQRVTVCHIPDGGGEPYSLVIDSDDLAEHLKHGDTEGLCQVDCMGIPNGQAAIDGCGVCGGDGSTCKDCLGVPNGGAIPDICGVCNGDGTSCLGCDGEPNSQKVIDACGVCGGDGSTCKDCLGVPNGGAEIDQCGVCAGDNSSCKDCSGTINGTLKIDDCGVCGGDNSTCPIEPSCKGTVDRCGVCNGNDACLDCAGVPNGGTTIDCCGVCGGDGSTCQELCQSYNLKSKKKKALRGIRKLLQSVKKYSQAQAKCAPETRAAAQKRILVAKRLSNQNQEILGTMIADSVKMCDTIFCKKSSYSDILQALKKNTRKLYKLSRSAQYGAARACGSSANGDTPRTAEQYLFDTRGSLRLMPTTLCNN